MKLYVPACGMTLAFPPHHTSPEPPRSLDVASDQYLAALWCVNRQWQAYIPDLETFRTAPTESCVLERAREALALALLDAPVLSLARTLEDSPELLRQNIPDTARLVMITPAPVNPLSLELQRAIQASGLSTEELARRLNTGHWVITRMLDPFHWKHSLATVRALADVLSLKVQVQLIP